MHSTAVKHYNEAILLPRGTTARAMLLRRAIELSPLLGPAYLSLGGDERRSGHVQAAVHNLDAATALMPGYAPAYHAFGEVLLAARRPAEALPHLETALSASPTFSPYEYQRGSALLAMYRMDEAAASLERAATLSPAHGISTTRNDAQQGLMALEAAAARSARVWAQAAARDAEEDTTRPPLSKSGRRSRVAVSADGHAAEGKVSIGLGEAEGRREREHEGQDAEEGEGEGEGQDEGEGQGAGADSTPSQAFAWLEPDLVTDEEAGPHASPRYACAVASVGNGASLAATEESLKAAADAGVPVLLRNATATWATSWMQTLARVGMVSQRAATTGGESVDGAALVDDGALEEPPLGEVTLEELLPISILHPPNASTNRLRTLDEVAGLLSPQLHESLLQQGVQGVLQRPLTEWMTLSTLLALVRSGRCRSRCYAKQVRLDLYLPRLLKSLRPPRLRVLRQHTLPLGEANLWLGGTATDRPVLTDLHKDARPNVLAVLRGRKRVLVLPPTDEGKLMPLRVLDVASSRDGRAEDEPVPGGPLLPQTVADSLIDRQHYARSVGELRARLLAQQTRRDELDHAPCVCSFTAEAGDALFIPPGWPHAVQTDGEADTSDFSAAVNFFYDVPHQLVCAELGRGKQRFMGREVDCGRSGDDSA